MTLNERLQSWISSSNPDPGLAIRERAFNTLVLGFWGLMLVISFLIILHWALDPGCSYGLTTVIATTFVNTMLPLSFFLSKKGHFTAGVWSFLSMLFLGTFIAHIARGETNAIILIFPIAVITAGLLLGFRSTLIALFMSIATFLAATVVLQVYGPYLEQDPGTLALNNAMAVVACLIVITIITWLFTKSTREYIIQLEASNREKEILLKEIHHRVKNNLQIVSSLLNLQMESIQDSGTRQMFGESVGRVRSMALVHEMLYSSRNISDIEFSGYVDRLLKYIGQTQNGPAGISFEQDIDDSALEIEMTLSLGLIINELVTNSMKHAFTQTDPRRQPKITVKFRKHIDDMELTVTDNGKGILDVGSLEKSETLGMQLVRTLVEELKGKMSIVGSDGTIVRMRFENGR